MKDPIRMPEVPSLTSGRLDVHGVARSPFQTSSTARVPRCIPSRQAFEAPEAVTILLITYQAHPSQK